MIWDALREDFERADREEAAAKGVAVEQLQRERADQQAEAEREYGEKMAQKEREKQERLAEYGKSIGLGVPARPAVSVALGGLYESRGDGQTRRSVTHVEVLGEFSHGRIHRRSHQFLCRTDTGSFGSGETRMQAPVTCPKCTDILDRVSANSDWRDRIAKYLAEREGQGQSRGIEVSR